MKAFILGTIFGIVIATVGFSGITKTGYINDYNKRMDGIS